mmetsp:Transcript_5048/g.13080  ORF Transcript_5048/g.13080 Transcript_5048/m.13080 type:complete len:242 (+) Transcript_5048:84-809(+)
MAYLPSGAPSFSAGAATPSGASAPVRSQPSSRSRRSSVAVAKLVTRTEERMTATTSAARTHLVCTGRPRSLPGISSPIRREPRYESMNANLSEPTHCAAMNSSGGTLVTPHRYQCASIGIGRMGARRSISAVLKPSFSKLRLIALNQPLVPIGSPPNKLSFFRRSASTFRPMKKFKVAPEAEAMTEAAAPCTTPPNRMGDSVGRMIPSGVNSVAHTSFSTIIMPKKPPSLAGSGRASTCCT